MRGNDGVRVGNVVAAEGSPGSLAVTVHYAVPDGRYTLAVRPPDGASTDVATIAIVDGRGAWTGRVERVGAPGFTVQLVDADGTVVCRAEVRA